MFSLILSVALGSAADYSKVNRCTSRFIQSVDAHLEVVYELPEKYGLQLDYQVKSAVASKSDVLVRNVDKYLFTEEFLIDLRNNGYYSGEDFSIRHILFDGTCDIVTAYNFDESGNEIDATVCFGEPVLGIVNAQFDGTVGGIDFRACVEID